MTTDRTILKPLPTAGLCPMDVAEMLYIKWGSRVPFVTDLADYLRTGVVIARPDIFGMAKIIDIAPATPSPTEKAEPEPAWFVRMAVGDLGKLLAALPCYLPKICFCRRGKEKMKEWPLKRMMKLALATEGK